MKLFRRHVADNIDVDGLRLSIPDVEADGERCHVGTDALGHGDGIGAALLHRLRQLEKQPVVEFAGEGMIGIHRL